MAVFRRKRKIILPAAPLLSTQGTSHIWRKYYFRMEINKEELFYTLALWRVSRPVQGRWDSGLWLSSRLSSSRLSSGQPAMAYFQACNLFRFAILFITILHFLKKAPKTIGFLAQLFEALTILAVVGLFSAGFLGKFFSANFCENSPEM